MIIWTLDCEAILKSGSCEYIQTNLVVCKNSPLRKEYGEVANIHKEVNFKLKTETS